MSTEFKKPELKKVIRLLDNNDALKKCFSDNGIYVSKEYFYDKYGKVDSSVSGLMYLANKEALEKISTLILDNSEHIIENSVKYLVSEQFLKAKLEKALNVSISRDVLGQIFYTYKYSYATSFFENNYKLFLPEYDAEQLENNKLADVFFGILCKEFDKFEDIMDNIPDFYSYSEIPYKYINYLTQKLGLEQNQFLLSEEDEGQFRELAANILDVYKIKGTDYSFQLFFNLIGLNIEISHFYFDRRFFYSFDGQNAETSTNKKRTYRYYLTSKDPRENSFEGFAIDEPITDADIGEKLNIFTFDDYVKELKDYGNSEEKSIKVMLGYDNLYTNENGIETEWEGPVYTYFKTNLISVCPTKKFSKGNLSENDNYRVSKLLEFLTPFFLKREIVVKLSNDAMIDDIYFNYTKDNFYLLDGEIFDDTLEDSFVINNRTNSYKDKKYALSDGWFVKDYTNSLGEVTKEVKENGESVKVFKMPIKAKYKIINTNKYIGSVERPINWGEDGRAYPFYQRSIYFTNGEGEKVREKRETSARTESNTIPDRIRGKKAYPEDILYYPKDKALANQKTIDKFENLNVVDYDGYNGYTMKKLSKIFNTKTAIDYVTDKPIVDFINGETSDKYKNSSIRFSKKGLVEKDNNTWTRYYSIKPKTVYENINSTRVPRQITAEEQLDKFVTINKNVVNYDYINKNVMLGETYNGNYIEYSEPLFKSLTMKNGLYCFKDNASSKPGNIIKMLNSYSDTYNYFIIKSKEGYDILVNLKNDPERITEKDIANAVKEEVFNGGTRLEIDSSFNESRNGKAITKKEFENCLKQVILDKNEVLNKKNEGEYPYVWGPTLAPESIIGNPSRIAVDVKDLYSLFNKYSLVGPNDIVNYTSIYDKDKAEKKYYIIKCKNNGVEESYWITKNIGTIKNIFTAEGEKTDDLKIVSIMPQTTLDKVNEIKPEKILKDAFDIISKNDSDTIGKYIYIFNVNINKTGGQVQSYQRQFINSSASFFEKNWLSRNHLFRSEYINRKPGQLIYSTADKKMYRINDTPYCLNNIAFDVNVNITKENIEYNVVFNNINSTLELLKNINTYISSLDIKKLVLNDINYNELISNKSIIINKDNCKIKVSIDDEKENTCIYGIEEVEFAGRLEIESDGEYDAYLYTFDKAYKSFDEKEDIDNYIFLNAERYVDLTDFDDKTIDIIKRPTRDKFDKLFDDSVTNERNIICENVIKKLCNETSDEFSYKELFGR